MDNYIYCPLVKKEISEGYCFDLCNVATDDILLDSDVIGDWEKAQEICKICGQYEN